MVLTAIGTMISARGKNRLNKTDPNNHIGQHQHDPSVKGEKSI